MTRLVSTISALRQLLHHQRDVGFVPTMGALHPGHVSLIQRAQQENSWVVVSIFVNPLQFGLGEDFDRYPRSFDQDLQLCEKLGVDVVFAPTPAEMGVDQRHQTQVVPDPSLTQGLCALQRPGHFTGVATIVTKLLNIVRPHRLYLGEKDAQQLAVIQKLVSDLCIPVEVIPCSTVRENNGLAYSSRNQYLTPAQKQTASHIYRGLDRAQKAFKQGERQRQALLAQVQLELADYPELELEYLDLVDAETLTPLERLEDGTVGLVAVSAKLGTTRLIDNVRLVCRRPIIAIDGPAGAGKSTVTSRVAKELGLLHLDTGAMYRSISLAVLQAGIDPEDASAVAEIAAQTPIELLPVHPLQVRIHGQNVTNAIRSSAVTKLVPTIAAQPAVRQILEKTQRHLGKKGGIVIEGRDIGTRIFPDAELKIFLTASVAERALRRQQELRARGEEVSLEELTQSIQERDHRDSTREVSPLRKADNAILINSDGISVDGVVAEIIRLYRQICHD